MKKKTIKIKVRYTDGTEQVLEIPGLQGDSGLSAYEIARQGGFEGTEEEWLASLKGEPYMLTAQDKQEIVGAVLAALPDGDMLAYLEEGDEMSYG